MKIENSSIENKFKLAIEEQKKNNLNIAEKIYEEILEIEPNHLESICYLATIFAQTKRTSLAKNFFLRAIEINPNNPRINNNLGNVSLQLGESQNALRYYEKAIKSKPNYPDAHINLGIAFKSLKKNEQALSCFEKAIKIQPEYIRSYNILGRTLKELGEYSKALICYEEAIKINPENTMLLYGILDLFTSIQFSNLTENNTRSFKKLILFLFKNNNIDHNKIFNNAKLLILLNTSQQEIEKIINSNSLLLNNKVIKKLLKEEFFHLILQKTFLTDRFLETLVTRIRKEILLSLEKKENIFSEYYNFIFSLAEQCFLNEYVFFKSEEENKNIINLEKKILNNIENNEIEIAILGSYKPLIQIESIKNKLLNYTSKIVLFNDMIDMQVKEPLREIELKNSIKSIKVISDDISKKVKDQYEENPYPRWRFGNKNATANFLFYLNNDIKPNGIEFNNKFIKPNVLIAGCGTGQQIINAIGYQNSNIVAVDLSFASLAYAKRKIEELGHKNVEFLQGDILNLNILNKKFDIIECAGVLHHMRKPLEGLKVLLNLLEPHGFLKLGLYSDKARKHIVKIREFIKKKKFKNTEEDIRNCREEILKQSNDPILHKVIHNFDFYSTSGTRDLIFHVQEHRYTIPEISKILKDLNLEFIGFSTNPILKEKYLQSFPNDKKNLSLDNWNEFEINNPGIFKGMYQFWIRKI
tara:strand:- start:389 stop:2485 length:2097 start_codon:yes stop_codon:yes gene_type:complete